MEYAPNQIQNRKRRCGIEEGKQIIIRTVRQVITCKSIDSEYVFRKFVTTKVNKFTNLYPNLLGIVETIRGKYIISVDGGRLCAFDIGNKPTNKINDDEEAYFLLKPSKLGWKIGYSSVSVFHNFSFYLGIDKEGNWKVYDDPPEILEIPYNPCLLSLLQKSSALKSTKPRSKPLDENFNLTYDGTDISSYLLLGFLGLFIPKDESYIRGFKIKDGIICYEEAAADCYNTAEPIRVYSHKIFSITMKNF